MNSAIKQGEIYWARLDPIEGSEQGGTRPVLIISGNFLNDHFRLVWIIPMTTQLKYLSAFPTIEPKKENNLREPSELLIPHIRAISKTRLDRKIGEISRSQLLLAIHMVNETMLV